MAKQRTNLAVLTTDARGWSSAHRRVTDTWSWLEPRPVGFDRLENRPRQKSRLPGDGRVEPDGLGLQGSECRVGGAWNVFDELQRF